MSCFSGDLWSSALRQTQHVNIIVPDTSEDFYPQQSGEPRVMYLLHGLGANANEWQRFSQIEAFAKELNFAVILPEVGRSFYQNTPAGAAYEQWIASELPELVRTWFRLPADRAHTYIAGESMGAYGACRIALNYPHSYQAAAPLSPVCDPATLQATAPQLFLSPRELDYSFSPTAGHVPTTAAAAADKGPGEQDTLAAQARLAAENFGTENLPNFFMVCGAQDSFMGDTQELANTMSELGISHTLESWDGAHDFFFWNGAIHRTMQAFCE